jgi:hypothetical protein
MASEEVQKLIGEIYQDSKVSPGEIVKLTSEVERAEQQVLQAEGMAGVTSALCKSFDVTNQLLQETLVHFKKTRPTDTGRAAVASMLKANIALLQATVDAFGFD